MSSVTLEKFEKWLEGLSTLDKMNFNALLSLPNAVELVGKLPEGEYREMAIFGLAVKAVVSQAVKEESRAKAKPRRQRTKGNQP